MKIGTSRVETFSDGVIAIIITIMVLSIKLPDMTKQATGISVKHSLQQMLPFLITYSVSFLMIGIFWLNHHHMFHLLEKTDESLLLQNLLFLFWVSLIPVATVLINANPLIKESVAFYGFILFMTTLTFSLMRSYTIKKKLVHSDRRIAVTREIYSVSSRGRTKSYVGTLAYLLSVPLAFVSVYISFICIAIPPILFFIPDGIDDEKLAQKISDKN